MVNLNKNIDSEVKSAHFFFHQISFLQHSGRIHFDCLDRPKSARFGPKSMFGVLVGQMYGKFGQMPKKKKFPAQNWPFWAQSGNLRLFSILTQYATFGTVETHAKISPIDVPLGGGPNRSTSSDLPEFLLVPICSWQVQKQKVPIYVVKFCRKFFLSNLD